MTTAVVVPQPAPQPQGLHLDVNLAIIGAIISIIVGVLAIWGHVNKAIRNVRDHERKLTEDDIETLEKKIDHNHANQKQVTQKLSDDFKALAMDHTSNVERIVKLETNYSHIQDGVKRLEEGQKTQSKHFEDVLEKRFQDVVTTIREISKREIK